MQLVHTMSTRWEVGNDIWYVNPSILDGEMIFMHWHWLTKLTPNVLHISDCPDLGYSYSSNTECVTASEIILTGPTRTQQCVNRIFADCELQENDCCVDYTCSSGRCVP